MEKIEQIKTEEENRIKKELIEFLKIEDIEITYPSSHYASIDIKLKKKEISIQYFYKDKYDGRITLFIGLFFEEDKYKESAIIKITNIDNDNYFDLQLIDLCTSLIEKDEVKKNEEYIKKLRMIKIN